MTPRIRRLLVLAWLFPPHTSIGSRRPYRFVRHLPAEGWQPTVLTGPWGYAQAAARGEWRLPAETRVVEAYGPAGVHRALADVGGRFRPRSWSPDLARPDTLARLLALADRTIQAWTPTETIAAYAPFAYRAAACELERTPHDAVLSTSYPYSAHIVGVQLSRRFHLPLVVDLRDPWTLNFIHDKKAAPTRWIERRLERYAFAAARSVTVTTETLAAEYRRIYGTWADKFVAIRNSFDELELPAARPALRPRRVIHFGHVYQTRSMSVVYRALAALRDSGKLAPGDLVLENYGRLADCDREEVARLGVGAFLSQRAEVPYTEGLAALRQASLLLLPAFATERERFFLPGKLYDYLLARRPILALTESDELRGILARTRTGTSVAYDDVAGIVAVLSRMLAGKLEDDFRPDDREIAHFGARGAAQALAGILDAL